MIYLLIAGIAGLAFFLLTRKKNLNGGLIGPEVPSGFYPQPENTGWNTPTEVRQLIKEICEEENFDNYKLAIAISYVESSFNKEAINTNDRPPSVGLMGLKIPTARYYVPTITEINHLYDAPSNVRAGVRFLQDLHNKWLSQYGFDAVIQMYNLGETRFLKGERNKFYSDKVKSYINTWDSRNASANP